MASDAVRAVGEAFDVHGRRIEIGQDHGAVYLDTGLNRYLYEGRELEKLRELLDRAAMPGRAEAHAGRRDGHGEADS